MSAKTVFISYRRDATGKFFARSIKEALTHHGYDVFLDVDCIDAGKWATQILTQVPKQSHFLLLLTPGALDRCTQEEDWVRKEFLGALAHGRNIVPVREESVNLTELRKSCPECMKALFEYQTATIQHGGFQRDIETLIERYIAPHKAPAETDARRVSNALNIPADISRIVKYAPAELIGREDELTLLHDAWAGRAELPLRPDTEAAQQPRPNKPKVLTFVALGGEGKTSLVAKWAAELAHQDWPGCDAAFAWSFYSQGTREQLAASSDLFLKEALTFFGDDADKQFAASAAGAFEKGQRLARIVGQRRSLLILDGLEPLQYAPTSPTPGQLKDQGIAALLKGLAANSHGLCVVTTRYSLPDLKAFWQTTALEVKLLRLSRDAGVHLLKTLGVNGTAKEFETLVEDVKGHALTLTLLGGFLKRAFHGDIRQRDRVKFEKADEKMAGGHAFRTMAAYEQWLLRDGGDEGRREVAVLRLMGLFDRPADAGCLAALRSKSISGLTKPLFKLADDDWEYCLSRLETAKLLTVNRYASGTLVSIDAHPLLRNYFAKQLRAKNLVVWRTAHRRLYEHLCATTPDKPQPTLEDLQPLYQAVSHGCDAGLQQEACDALYHDRINRGQEFYSTTRIGAFGSDLGAVACFFKHPWNDFLPNLTKTSQAFLLNQAAFRLHALGRLTEAIEPLTAAIQMAVTQENWKDAAVRTSNLSDLEMTLGDVTRAKRDAVRSMEFAERSKDPFEQITKRVRAADALNQAGAEVDAAKLFADAEQLQALGHTENRLLFSLAGFQYCELLLAPVERAVWRQFFTMAMSEAKRDVINSNVRRIQVPFSALAEICREVTRRSDASLKIVSRSSRRLGDLALDRTILGRVALYEAILCKIQDQHQDCSTIWESARHKLDSAVDSLRIAAVQHFIPRGLLTRAWLRFLSGTGIGPESAQEDLDEAWEIAERGPMKLFLADIHLHRARLFFREKEYPWISPQADLAAAEKLINDCGYHRRDEELADAKKAILGLS